MDALALTRGALADIVGVHRVAVGEWIRGVRVPQRRSFADLIAWIEGRTPADRCARCRGMVPGDEATARTSTGESLCDPCAVLIDARRGAGGAT
jgi:hypothetical protein